MKDWKTSLGGLGVGIPMIINGVAAKDWGMVISGVAAILMGLFAKDTQTAQG